jgi:endonuclease/exonuclease/phosphatase family metal-dependent hydrolase
LKILHVKKNKTALVLIGLFLFAGCSKRTTGPDTIKPDQRLVKKEGTEATFDIATWNVRDFPLDGRTTVSTLARLIRDLDIDMFGLEEMNDVDAFNSLLDSLDDFDGFISEYPGDMLKLGIIYKKNMVSITTPFQIYTSDWYAFPRPPLITYVEVKKEGTVVFNFSLIVNHLKAYGDLESVDRRRDACIKLKDYIDNQILSSSDPDFIMLGDFNDRLNDPPDQNVFEPFLRDSLANYLFLTQPLTDQASYIGDYGNVIDHIVISHSAEEVYQGGSTEILKLETEFDAYTTVISDHRPVLSRFPVF